MHQLGFFGNGYGWQLFWPMDKISKTFMTKFFKFIRHINNYHLGPINVRDEEIQLISLYCDVQQQIKCASKKSDTCKFDLKIRVTNDLDYPNRINITIYNNDKDLNGRSIDLHFNREIPTSHIGRILTGLTKHHIKNLTVDLCSDSTTGELQMVETLFSSIQNQCDQLEKLSIISFSLAEFPINSPPRLSTQLKELVFVWAEIKPQAFPLLSASIPTTLKSS